MRCFGYFFHNTEVSDKIKHGRHAVAMDEKRASFSPTLWTKVEDHPDLKQIWFPGIHRDVGGGCLEAGLSDGSLEWMMDEASALGLALNPAMKAQLKPDPSGVLHDSYTGVFKLLRTQPRPVPAVRQGNLLLHKSTLERHRNPPITQAPYRPTTILAAEQKKQVNIYAEPHWNNTGIYLEAGRYEMKATGKWLDKSIPCGPGGTNDGKFYPGEAVHLLASLWGKVEGVVGSMMNNKEMDFKGTRRYEQFPWFSLVGAIADAGNPGKDGTPPSHRLFLIGEGANMEVKKAGYLYGFANDAWDFYDNNRGSVQLTVTRIS